MNTRKVDNKSTFGDWRDSIQNLSNNTYASLNVEDKPECLGTIKDSFGRWACDFNEATQIIHTKLYPAGDPGTPPPVPYIQASLSSAGDWVIEINKGWEIYTQLFGVAAIPADAANLVCSFDLRYQTMPGVGELDVPTAVMVGGTVHKKTLYGALWREDILHPARIGVTGVTDPYVKQLKREKETWCLESHGEPAFLDLGAEATGAYHTGIFTSGIISPPITTQGKPFTIRMLYSGNSRYAIKDDSGVSAEHEITYVCMFASVKQEDTLHTQPVAEGSSYNLHNRVTTEGPFFREARAAGIPELDWSLYSQQQFRAHPYIASGRDRPFYLVRMTGETGRDQAFVDLYKYANEILDTRYDDMSAAIHIVFCFEANCRLCGVIIDGEMLGIVDLRLKSGSFDRLGGFVREEGWFRDNWGVHGTVGGGMLGTPYMGMQDVSLAVGSFSFPYYNSNIMVERYENYGLGGTIGALEVIGYTGAPLEEGSDTFKATQLYAQMEEAKTHPLTNADTIYDIVNPAAAWVVMENQTARLAHAAELVAPAPLPPYSIDAKTMVNVLKRTRGHKIARKLSTHSTTSHTPSYHTSIGQYTVVDVAGNKKRVQPQLRNPKITHGLLSASGVKATTSGGMAFDNLNGLSKTTIGADTLIGQDYLAFDIDVSKAFASASILKVSAGSALQTGTSSILDPSYEVMLVVDGGTYAPHSLNWRGRPYTPFIGEWGDDYPYLHGVPLVATSISSLHHRPNVYGLSCRRRNVYTGAELTTFNPATSTGPIPREENPGGFALLQVYTHTAGIPVSTGVAYTAIPTPLFRNPEATSGADSWNVPQLHPYKTQRVEIYRYKDTQGRHAYRFIVDGRVSDPLYPVQEGTQTDPGLSLNVSIATIEEQPTNPDKVNLWTRLKLELLGKATGAVLTNITFGIPEVSSAGALVSVRTLASYAAGDILEDSTIPNTAGTAMKALQVNVDRFKALTRMWAPGYSNKAARQGAAVDIGTTHTILQQYTIGPTTTASTPPTVPLSCWWYDIGSGTPVPRYKGYEAYKFKMNMLNRQGSADRWARTDSALCVPVELAVYPTSYTWATPISDEFAEWAGDDLCYKVDEPPTVQIIAPETAQAEFDVQVIFSQDVTGLSVSDFATTFVHTLTLTGSGYSYFLHVVTPGLYPGENITKIKLPAGKVTGEFNGKHNLESNNASVLIKSRVSGTLGVTSTQINGPFTVYIEFDEAVTGLSMYDFSLTNITALSLSGSGSSYELHCDIVGPGVDMIIYLPAYTVTSVWDGSPNYLSSPWLKLHSAPAATPILSSRPHEITPNSVFYVDIEFNVGVSGLRKEDIHVTHCTKVDLTGTGSSYVLKLKNPTATVDVTVPEGAASDSYTGQRTDAATLHIGYYVPADPVIATVNPADGGSYCSDDSCFFTTTIEFNVPVTSLMLGDFKGGTEALPSGASFWADIISVTVVDGVGSYNRKYAITFRTADQGTNAIVLRAYSVQSEAGISNPESVIYKNITGITGCTC